MILRKEIWEKSGCILQLNPYLYAILIETFSSTWKLKSNMTKKTNHVIPSKGGVWAVKKSGSSRSSQTFERKEDAVKYGRNLSRKENTDLFVHKKDGTIQERNSY
ncbi:MAG TPA: DUF2188 domain-containing protein [Saprospiraceae bacterium]|nr:DUF2188 domain-containing protein [Saprospiraceae bacterium]